jgi:cell division protein FtsX
MASIAYGVIADARAVQRRRRIRLVVVAVLAAAAAILVAAAVRHRRHPATQTVFVDLRYETTGREAQVLLSTARAQPGVVDASYVSAADALARMRRRYPLLVRNLTSNPLPDSLKLRVRPSDVPEAEQALRRRLGASIQKIVVDR